MRSCLLVAFGVAAGITVASFTPRPAGTLPPPQVGTRTGHIEADGSVRALRPVSLRVGDQITQLGEPDPERRDRALVYLDLNGVPVILALAIEPNPAGTPAPVGPPSPTSGFLARPTPVLGAGLGVAARIDS